MALLATPFGTAARKRQAKVSAGAFPAERGGPASAFSLYCRAHSILVTDKLGQVFNQTIVPLRHTPRKVVVHAASRNLIVIESDHRTFSAAERAKRGVAAGAAEAARKPAPPAQEDDMEMDDSAAPAAPAEGAAAGEDKVEFDVKAPEGVWSSCIRIIDPAHAATVSCIDLEDNEAAVVYATAASARCMRWLARG